LCSGERQHRLKPCWTKTWGWVRFIFGHTPPNTGKVSFFTHSAARRSNALNSATTSFSQTLLRYASSIWIRADHRTECG
jgi:hypothetical protein